MLTREDFKFPSGGDLLFERRFGVLERLNLRLKFFSLIEVMHLTLRTVNFKSVLILIPC